MEKNKKERKLMKVFGIIGFLIELAIIEAYIAPLNPEVPIQNWGIGIIGFFIFSVLYFPDTDRILFRPKKVWFFLMTISVCFILVDWTDLILFMRGG